MEIDVLPRILNSMDAKLWSYCRTCNFSNLDSDPLIDDLITKCWHNKYATIADLAAYTETLLPGRSNWRLAEAETISIPQWRMVIGRVIRDLWQHFRSWWVFVLCRTREAIKPEDATGRESDGSSGGIGPHSLADFFSKKKTLCQNLEKRGLLQMLSRGEPEQLGFSLEWYRHSTS